MKPMLYFSPRTTLICAAISLLPWAQASAAPVFGGEAELPTEMPNVEPSAQEEAPLDFRVFWKDSIRLESNDGAFKFKIGGRIQNDYWFIPGETDGLKDELAGRNPSDTQIEGTAFRRARVYMSGTLAENVVFKWSYEFAGGAPDFKDVYIGWENVPGFGRVTVGQQKEPSGFEFAYSSNTATFIERGLPHSMNPERNTGIRFQRNAANDSLYLTGGLYRITDDQGLSEPTGEAWAISGRAAWIPVFDNKGEELLHLGFNGSYRGGLDSYAKSTGPAADGMSRYVGASVNNVDKVTILGFEASANHGPLSLQSEYVVNIVDQDMGGSSDWAGWYAYASWFLTGEHRPYRRDRGAYTGVTPLSNYSDSGSGALEFAARYSAIDYQDNNNTVTTGGGRLGDITAGFNWYMNYNTRLMFNYSHADLVGVGSSDAVFARLQIFF